MSESTHSLTSTAAAVESLGCSQAEIDLLNDESLQDGMARVREHRQQLQRYELWLATTIARRSDHTLGYSGLARKSGFPTPATFIQSMTGGSLDEATKLARLGEMVIEAEAQAAANASLGDAGEGGPSESGELGESGGSDNTGGSQGTAIAIAATTGGISLACADAIRRGLGVADAAVTAELLRVEAEKLIAHAQSATVLGSVTPEALLKLARQARNRLDLEAIDRGQKERAAVRYVRTWRRDGLSGGSWCLPDEDGGLEIVTALKLLLAKTHGGPRFPSTNTAGEPIEKTAAEIELEDTRTGEQVVADGFAQIFHNGITADPSVVPAAGRAAVRVIVSEKDLTQSTGAGTGGRRSGAGAGAGATLGTESASNWIGSALLEENMSAISFAKLEEYLCEGGTVGVVFNDDGTIDVGREQRLFTGKQRTALGVRDGGCRFPGCDKPPSWTEAHHIQYWKRDRGRTDTINGILLCRYHHMFIHDRGWEIIRIGTAYWLKPPASIDPGRVLIEMPSKNPIIAAMRFAEAAS